MGASNLKVCSKLNASIFTEIATKRSVQADRNYVLLRLKLIKEKHAKIETNVRNQTADSPSPLTSESQMLK